MIESSCKAEWNNALPGSTVQLDAETTREEAVPELGDVTSGDVAGASSSWRLADGRILPRLVFATNSERLGAKIGSAADTILRIVGEAGHDLVDAKDDGKPWREVAQAAAGAEGIVILGGYDVLRAQRLDAAPSALRSSGILGDDMDDYVIWSDECYGDTDGDGLPDLPVSRIPDAGSADFLLRALCRAVHAPQAQRFGIRNLNRPYAEQIFPQIPGTEALHISAPFPFGSATLEQMNASGLYFVLHGSKQDPSMYWGEQADKSAVEAFSRRCVPAQIGGVVLAGVCWGGLAVDKPACETSDLDKVTQLTADKSIALGFLEAGANAFIGATGAHWSPISGDIHSAFWERLANGVPPAKALFEAKAAFVPKIMSWSSQAELGYMFKTWRQFTCLGLGW